MCQLGKTSKPTLFQSCLYCIFPGHFFFFFFFFSVGINLIGIEELDLLGE